MPWTAADALKHNKGLSAAQQRQWAHVANAALEKCQKEGGTNCDASAIRQANGVVKKSESAIVAMGVIDEAGRMISSANKKIMNDAMAAMKAAMDHLENLMQDEPVKESDLAQIEQPAELLEEVRLWNLSEIALKEAAKVLAQDDSFDSIRALVAGALRRKSMMDSQMSDPYSYYDYGSCPYIRDMYPDTVIYSQQGELYQCDYSVDGQNVTLGDPTAVKVSYVPVSSQQEAREIELEGDLVELVERAVSEDGAVKIKLISPGWGSSGYYSEAMLKRDGKKAFKKGTHMYINHPTESESEERPERDLKDLAGVLEEDATYQVAGPTGPGLYAAAKVFGPHREFIDEAAPYIGTSIRASGRAVEGEAEGKRGVIVDGIVEGHSVDYVTLPGRGGQVLQIMESKRIKEASNSSDYAYVPDPKKPSTWKLDISDATHVAAAIAALGKGFRGNKVDIPSNELSKVKAKVRAAWKKFNPDKTDADMPDAIKESREVTEEEAKQLKEALENNRIALEKATTELARMKERDMLRDAREMVVEQLKTIELPDVTRIRLAETLSKNPPVKDGELDKETLTTTVKEAAIEEMKYLATVTTSTGGTKVVGVGITEVSDEDKDKALQEAFKSLGLPEAGAIIAVNGRK